MLLWAFNQNPKYGKAWLEYSSLPDDDSCEGFPDFWADVSAPYGYVYVGF